MNHISSLWMLWSGSLSSSLFHILINKFDSQTNILITNFLIFSFDLLQLLQHGLCLLIKGIFDYLKWIQQKVECIPKHCQWWKIFMKQLAWIFFCKKIKYAGVNFQLNLIGKKHAFKKSFCSFSKQLLKISWNLN